MPGSLLLRRFLSPTDRKKLESLQLIRASGMFDAAWYARQHPEVGAEGWTAAEHYLEVGARSGYAPSPRFDGIMYTMLRPEIVEQHVNPLAHFATSGGPLPEPLDLDAGRHLRCCVLVHLFYADLWDELAAYLASLQGTCATTMLVNIPEPAATLELRRRIERRFPQARIVVSPNRGRDIGGFFRLLSLVDFADHDVFMLVHSKRSPHCKAHLAGAWRHRLLNALLGSRDIVRENLAIFATHPKIGGLAAAGARRTDISRNGPAYAMLVERLGVPEPLRDCEYVTGTMLMLRSEVLRRLYEPIADVQFELGDNMPLDFHIDGQLAHGIERCVGAVMRTLGFRMAWRPAPDGCDVELPPDPLPVGLQAFPPAAVAA
ncbi:MAG: rhamnan synthesis F family protein [Geminicoccaceae bacterium]